MRKLGQFGRFANQLFQYAFLRTQQKTGYQCPRWIGQEIFGLDDPPITKELPRVKETNIYDAAQSRIIGRDDIDILGYFQYHTSWWRQYKDYMRELFTPLYRDPTVTDLQKKGYTVIGIHIRRGDYGTFTRDSAKWAFRAPCSWYRRWLRSRDIPNSILFIASDEPVLPEFQDFECVTSGDMYGDFYGLTQTDILLISNSSFGFMASMLNTRVCETWRPRLSAQALVPYDPWDAHTVFRDEKYD